MIKNKNIISAILLAGLTLGTLNGVYATDNALVQMDIRRSSNDSLDFTMITSGSTSEVPVVSKKSDNKYVILMPNVSGSQAGKPDLSAIKDMVSDIDIKSIDDGAEGYTKVTVITKKPINIKTNVESGKPVTEEQAEYRQLIAKARANSIKTSQIPANEVPVSMQTKTATPKTAVTVNQVQPKVEIKPAAKQGSKITFKEVNPKELLSKHTPETPKKVSAPVKLEPVEIKEKPVAKIAEALPSADVIKDELEKQIANAEQAKQEALQNIKKEDVLIPVTTASDKTSELYLKFKDKASRHLPEGVPVGLVIVLLPILGLMLLAKMIRASVQKSDILKQSFLENINNRPEPVKNYDDIIGDEDLSWQEKYNKYLDKTTETPKKSTKKVSRYKFISLPQEDTVEDVNIEEKREELERTINAADAVRPKLQPKAIVTTVEKLEKLDDTPAPIKEIETPKKEIKSEDSEIHESLTKTVKLKAFAQSVSLEETSRRKSLNKSKAELLKDEVSESTNVPLQSTKLSQSRRQLADANLNVAQVSEVASQPIEMKAPEMTNAGYEMSSVEEYLSSVIDDIPTSKPEKKEVTVASTLAQIKPSMKYQKSESSNPIATSRSESKKSYMDGLIVKSGFNIDEQRGFYVVNVDGTSALVGRVGEEVFVLKKFDNNVEKPIQVRRDQQNVYMVKADGYRSLVKVDEEKMGVLVEM